jgi:hypothetical protein
VESLAQQVCSLADNQATIVGSVRQQVDQALQTSESILGGVLILVRPRLVWWQICSSSETEVYCVERHDQVISTKDGLEDGEDARFGADLPDKILVCDGVIEAHAFVVDLGEVLGLPGATVIAVVSKTTVLR